MAKLISWVLSLLKPLDDDIEKLAIAEVQPENHRSFAPLTLGKPLTILAVGVLLILVTPLLPFYMLRNLIKRSSS